MENLIKSLKSLAEALENGNHGAIISGHQEVTKELGELDLEEHRAKFFSAMSVEELSVRLSGIELHRQLPIENTFNKYIFKGEVHTSNIDRINHIHTVNTDGKLVEWVNATLLDMWAYKAHCIAASLSEGKIHLTFTIEEALHHTSVRLPRVFDQLKPRWTCVCGCKLDDSHFEKNDLKFNKEGTPLCPKCQVMKMTWSGHKKLTGEPGSYAYKDKYSHHQFDYFTQSYRNNDGTIVEEGHEIFPCPRCSGTAACEKITAHYEWHICDHCKHGFKVD